MALLVGGVAFIAVASLGVARLPDVFQRMHAATKAGGIGTSLVVLGVLVGGGVGRPVTGILTVLFMLLTLSVSSQLLARAAYLSGAPLEGLERGDPLDGVLDRTAVEPGGRNAPGEAEARQTPPAGGSG
jgi:multicomponent Na+:H+ antiporter subunit G